MALPEILLPASTGKTAGPSANLKQRPNNVQDAEIHRKKVQAEHAHAHERADVKAAVIHTGKGDLDKRITSDMERMKQAILFLSFLTCSWGT